MTITKKKHSLHLVIKMKGVVFINNEELHEVLHQCMWQRVSNYI